MTSVLLLQTADPAMPDLAADFRGAGFDIAGTGDCANLVRDALRLAPDVVVCWASRPGEPLLRAVTTLLAQQSVPLLVFTQDAGAELMGQALKAGVHAWVVQGYAPQRLRPLVHLAQARESREQELRAQLADLGERLEERKVIDKAKGILMRARDVSEDEAFQLLRTASMHGNQKVGQVSRQVIESARIARAINRAGQQRMLSQRVVKLYALGCSNTDATAAALLMRESVQRVEDNLAALEAELSPMTFGDLNAAARQGWLSLRRLLESPASAAQLPQLDALAEALLTQSDTLVNALESSGLAQTAGVVNVAGRQRMLSQRVAKLALMAGPSPAAATADALAAAQAAFEEGLSALGRAPLSTPEIRELLAAGRGAWDELRAAVPKASDPAGRMRIAAASEELLGLFDRLTEAYQHSIQVLIGS